MKYRTIHLAALILGATFAQSASAIDDKYLPPPPSAQGQGQPDFSKPGPTPPTQSQMPTALPIGRDTTVTIKRETSAGTNREPGTPTTSVVVERKF